ncbi:regulatory protein RecX [Protaetiibacter larvae]|nr:regulatory protein RecX [Protaetiibacter larvae]
MDGTEDRLAPVSYLFGSASDSADEPRSECDEIESLLANGLSDELARAAEASQRALARRALSRREVERVLRDKGFSEDAIGTELARLSAYGLVDDSALAQDLVASLQERKGLGRTAIAAELARRLLVPSAIAYALELVDSGDELARARELAGKRAGQLGGLDRDTAVRRLSGYLARRGYSGSTVRAAVEQALPASSPRPVVRFR